MDPEVKPSLLSIDDSHIVYVCGHNTVIFNTENKNAKFIPGKFLMAPRLTESIVDRNRGHERSHSNGDKREQEVYSAL